MPHQGIPKGRVEGPLLFQSKVFENTVRDYWIYVPAAVRRREAGRVMVFQDGDGYVNADGTIRVPIVFDNLIHKKRDAGDDRHLHQPGHIAGSGAARRSLEAQQPQLRVRHASATSTPAS